MRLLVGIVLLGLPLTACGGSEEAADTSSADTPAAAEAPAPEVPEGLQVVQVKVEGDAYIFSPTNVQAGKPVRLVFDLNSLPGCSRDVTLPDFDITKTISEGDTSIEFTPEAQGPIAVQCTMNMYRGTLMAESTLQPDPPQ
jgi:plastocyanin domain-containing protein